MRLGEFDDFLDALGYAESPNFLKGEHLACANGFGHIFRRACVEPCSLQGVYALRPPEVGSAAPIVPVVYVCRAESERQADEVHRLVWNQDVVPFLFVHTPTTIRLYSGFRYQHRKKGSARGVLRVLQDFHEVAGIAKGFRADRIDDGTLWREWGRQVSPEQRVNWQLLENLKALDGWLQRSGGLPRATSHALIGKYVYLHYLKDREILSDRKLKSWGIEKGDVFGPGAKLDTVADLVEHLDEWLNGRVFPLDFRGQGAPREDHLRRIAGTFSGDEPAGTDDWQLHLDFERYDFSYLPIETLSVIYEQFLHAPAKGAKMTRGRAAGAYYTPIPVVNLMLAELEDRHPLKTGMRVFDPACGSGAFLVQCYRRLIEKEFPPPPHGETKPSPRQLRELLEQHIFGVDRDADACSVAELSLTLTLLDYVDPPDLENDHRVKLPALRDQNIFCDNFFADDGAWRGKLTRRKCDWIVGNPPWKRLNPNKLAPDDRPVWDWMKRNEVKRPVGGNQVARAFAWEAADYVASDGKIALFLPAMTLFEDPSRAFRAAFLQRMKVHAVANLANLAEVLSAGRFRVPAAVFFYEPRRDLEEAPSGDEAVTTYCPLVANQESTRPVTDRTRGETWSLVINASEMRDIPLAKLLDGSGLPWKLATWGSHLDERLLRRFERRFPTLKELEGDGRLVLSEGLELRRQNAADEGEKVEYVREVLGEHVLDVKPLKGLRHVFAFPSGAIAPVDPSLTYARAGRVALPLGVCRPPHVIVSAARNFAVYSDEYLIVPARQIGIASPSNDKALLKALSLYLSSDFAFYHQFLTSTQFGVQRGLATLGALRKIPIPLAGSTRRELQAWVDLHSKLIRTAPRRVVPAEQEQAKLDFPNDAKEDLDTLLKELNGLVSNCLGLDSRERALVHDLRHVRLELNDGKLGKPAVRVPSLEEIRAYAGVLKSELDTFIGNDLDKRHDVGVVYDSLSGMIQVNLTRDRRAARGITVLEADAAARTEFEKARRRLRERHAQWVYFNRNLRVYEGRRTFVLKPMQRFHWTESQAMFDAAEIIAETLAGPGGER